MHPGPPGPPQAPGPRDDGTAGHSTFSCVSHTALRSNSSMLPMSAADEGLGGPGTTSRSGARWVSGWAGAAALVRFYFGDASTTRMSEVPLSDGYKTCRDEGPMVFRGPGMAQNLSSGE